MNPKDTYVNPLLTNVSVGYKNDSFIAGQLFPTVPVKKKSGQYFVKDKANLRSNVDANRGMYAEANLVSNNLTTEDFTLHEKSLQTRIPKDILDMYDDPFDPKRNATELVTELLEIQRENRLQDILLAAAAGDSTITTDLNGSWSTTSTDIIDHARAARNNIQKRTLKKANTVLLGKPAYDLIFTNAAFKELIKYTARPTEAQIKNAIADFFDVQRVLIGEAVENTGAEGAADNLDYIWGDIVVFAYVESSPAIEKPTAGYNLALENGRYVDEWWDQGIKCQYVRANDYYDDHIVDPGAMYIYTDVKA